MLVFGHEFDLYGSRDVRHRSSDHLIPHRPFLIGSPLSLTVSEIFNDECNVMVDMILKRPLNKGTHFGTNRFVIYTTFYRLSIVTFALGRTV